MIRVMNHEPFFHLAGDTFHATQACRGPWDPTTLHGAVIVALLAWEIERLYGAVEYLPARLCVDMYHLPILADPIQVSTRVVRDGYRIKVIDAEFFSKGASVARATCQLLRKTENATTRVWGPTDWDVPLPEDIPAPTDGLVYREGDRLRRPINGGMGTFGQKRMWLAEQRCLVDEIPLTPWMRAALIADFTNPWANSGEGGLGYINSDVTLYLHRLPVDEWLGMEVVNHQASEGICLGECRLYDRQGSLGTSTVTGLAQSRRAPGPGKSGPAK